MCGVVATLMTFISDKWSTILHYGKRKNSQEPKSGLYGGYSVAVFELRSKNSQHNKRRVSRRIVVMKDSPALWDISKFLSSVQPEGIKSWSTIPWESKKTMYFHCTLWRFCVLVSSPRFEILTLHGIRRTNIHLSNDPVGKVLSFPPLPINPHSKQTSFLSVLESRASQRFC